MCRKCDLSLQISIAADFFSDKEFAACELLLDDLPSGVITEGKDDLEYLCWGTECLQYIKTYFPSHYDNVFDIFYHKPIKHHKKIWMLLVALKNYEPESNANAVGEEKNHINIHQYQNNQNIISIHILMDAVKNEISAEEFEELKKMITDREQSKTDLKRNIIEKLKSFGGDVTSNILANVLTNPSFYSL